MAAAGATAAVLALTGGGQAVTNLASTSVSRTQSIGHHRLRPLTHITATTVLNRAAYVALQTTPLTPNPDQFVYTKTGGAGTDAAEDFQSWMSVDGKRASLEQFGNSAPITLPACAAQATGCTIQPAFYPDMPTDAGSMESYLSSIGDTYPAGTNLPATAWTNDLAKNIGYMLSTDYLLPAQQAALYRYLATTPGITVVQSVTDAMGRPGIGVGWDYLGGKNLLIFDPNTYQFLGMTTVGIQGQVRGYALLQTAIVNRAGEQPAQSSAEPSQSPSGTA